MGIRGKISKSTLADANKNRAWRIYADFAPILIHNARSLYSDKDFGVELKIQFMHWIQQPLICVCLFFQVLFFLKIKVLLSSILY